MLTGHRRRGITTRLIGRLERDFMALGAAKIVVEVRGSNAVARAVCARLGFRELGATKDYYARGVDGALAEKRLRRGRHKKGGGAYAI